MGNVPSWGVKQLGIHTLQYNLFYFIHILLIFISFYVNVGRDTLAVTTLLILWKYNNVLLILEGTRNFLGNHYNNQASWFCYSETWPTQNFPHWKISKDLRRQRQFVNNRRECEQNICISISGFFHFLFFIFRSYTYWYVPTL